jgi:hypothetical protein
LFITPSRVTVTGMGRLEEKRKWVGGFVACLLLVPAAIAVLYLRTERQRAAALADIEPVAAEHFYRDLRDVYSGSRAPGSEVYRVGEFSSTLSDALAHIETGEEILDSVRNWTLDYYDEYSLRFFEDTVPQDADYEWLEDVLGAEFELYPAYSDVIDFSKRAGPLHPLKLEDGALMELPHLAPARSVARYLSAWARIQAYRGDYEAAAKSVAGIIGVADMLAIEPLIISQLVRVVILGSAYDTVCDVIPDTGLSPDARGILLSLSHTEELRQSFADALRFEALVAHRFLRATRGDLKGFSAVVGASPDPVGRFFARAYVSPFGAPVAARDEYHILRFGERLAEAVTDPEYDPIRTHDELASALNALPQHYRMTHSMVPGTVRTPNAMLRAEVQIRLMHWGLLIEAYRDAHGRYPESLAEVESPHGLSRKDPYTSSEFVYRTEVSGFLLYSVGENGTDEGGLFHFRNGDIVWRAREQQNVRRTLSTSRVQIEKRKKWPGVSGDAIGR